MITRFFSWWFNNYLAKHWLVSDFHDLNRNESLFSFGNYRPFIHYPQTAPSPYLQINLRSLTRIRTQRCKWLNGLILKILSLVCGVSMSTNWDLSLEVLNSSLKVHRTEELYFKNYLKSTSCLTWEKCIICFIWPCTTWLLLTD